MALYFYYAPKIKNVSVTRHGALGIPSPNGAFLRITATREFCPFYQTSPGTAEVISNKCEIRYRYRMLPAGAYSAWTTILASSVTHTNEVTTDVMNVGLVSGESYEVIVGVKDDVGEANTSIVLTAGDVFMHRDGEKNSIGIGEAVAEENTVSIAAKMALKVKGLLSVAKEVLVGSGKFSSTSVDMHEEGYFGNFYMSLPQNAEYPATAYLSHPYGGQLIANCGAGRVALTGLTEPVDASDAVNKEYVDSKYVPVSIGTVNADTAYDGGLYMCQGGLNLPSASQYGILFVLPYRHLSGNTFQDFAAQIFVPNGDDKSKPNSFFYRTSTKNEWNAWQEVAIKDDLGSYLPLKGGTLTGDLNGTNEYLAGSLYVGGKKSTTDGKTGVAFGASGNITMQGADTPTLNFIHGSSTSPQASINMAGKTYQLHFKSKGNMLFYPISTNNTYFALLANAMYHSTDNAVSCGASGKRWSTVYAGTGTINTSDRNEKENIRDIDEKYIRLFEKLRPVTYEFIGGNHDRVHIGYISQEVKDAMDEVGLTDLEFAGYCRDKKTEDVLDENGVLLGTKDVLDENGEQAYLYALRYAEFIALNTKMIQLQQKTIQEQQEKIEAMEKEMRELKETVLSALRKHNIDI